MKDYEENSNQWKHAQIDWIKFFFWKIKVLIFCTLQISVLKKYVLNYHLNSISWFSDYFHSFHYQTMKLIFIFAPLLLLSGYIVRCEVERCEHFVLCVRRFGCRRAKEASQEKDEIGLLPENRSVYKSSVKQIHLDPYIQNMRVRSSIYH